MTREELREYVEEQRNLNNIPYHVYSALINGIDTLEQEPQSFKWCTDCREYDQEKHCCHRWSKVIRDAVKALEQELRKGHWISRWYAGHDLHFHVCSECNEEFSCDMETGISIENYRYCPNCGCRMVEPQESEGNE